MSTHYVPDSNTQAWMKTEAAKAARQIEASVLLSAATHLVTYCPDHGNKDTAFIACQCLAAEELRDMAKQTGGDAA